MLQALMQKVFWAIVTYRCAPVNVADELTGGPVIVTDELTGGSVDVPRPRKRWEPKRETWINPVS